MPDRLLTVQEVADQLSMTPVQLRKLIRQRHLLAVNVGTEHRHVYRVEQSEVARFIESRRTQPLTAGPSRRRRA